MATISRIKPGQILYDRHKYRMSNTQRYKWGVWEVLVKEVDPNGKFIIASWNGNSPQKMGKREVSKLHVKEPKM